MAFLKQATLAGKRLYFHVFLCIVYIRACLKSDRKHFQARSGNGEVVMASRKVVNIGAQQFDRLIEENKFYIDKTGFIREWWETGADVTLITRPRRFGKTLNMSMVECFSQTSTPAEVICLRGFLSGQCRKIQRTRITGTYRGPFL